jgi:uncharacterized protein
VHLIDGRLRRTSRDGVAGGAPGILEDYADLAEGLLALHQVDTSTRWLVAAGELLETALARFVEVDGDDVTVHDTADDAERLIRRPWDPTDNATPSGHSALSGALTTFGALTGSARHLESAGALLRQIAPIARQHPRFAGWSLAVGEALADGPRQIAVVGEAGAGPLTDTARRERGPGAVVVSGDPDQAGLDLLADRPLVEGRPSAYVCRGMVCDLPVTTPEELTRQLSR